MTFGMNTSVSAAITATTGVSFNPISLTDAYYGSAPNSIDVTASPSAIYISSNVAGDVGQFFTLNSMVVAIIVNGNQVSSNTYTTWNMTGLYGRIGFYGTDYYTVGTMNSGPILSGYGTRDSFNPYTTSLTKGDKWEAKMTYDIQGQGPVTSTATVTFVPEPASSTLIALSAIVFLRRKR